MRSPQIELNGAPSQYDRWLRALDPGYAKVDGRSLQELQAFAVEFARLIRYYNLQDRTQGNWVNFFVADPHMVLASLETMDLAEAERRFSQLEQRIAQAPNDQIRWKHLREAM